ncbi:MAG TPA: amino acid adenylation domain-containing protein, partial [Gemmatimonadales bacterium]|nr:amino acid adenylation domain-containing protein [Gemmatimonadales bacterium]
ARFLGHLATLLTGAAANPSMRVSRLPLLTPDERADLSRWNDTAWDEGPAVTVAALVERHAARVPAQIAVRSGNGALTWSELNARANRLAHRLIREGVGPGVTVGLCLDRSTDLIAGLLGILKAGGAYVPLVPDLPAARLAQQVGESGSRLVVTSSAYRGILPATIPAICLDADAPALAVESDQNPGPRAGPEDLAYVLFTSGSTGVPKGVAVSNANLVHYTRAIARVLGLDLGGSDQPWQCATVSTLGADLGHTALFPALCSGGTVHLIPAEATTDGARFSAWVAEHPIDLLKITPNHFRALSAGGNLSALLPRRWLVFGGEPCPWDFADEALRSGGCRVLNHYGPTETTVGVCTHEIIEDDPTRGRSASVPIGTPIANTRAMIRDGHGELVPVGIPGELLVGGAGVAQGYLHRDELTRERFLPDPDLPGARLYRTGDRVRRLATGDIEFLGRADDQVKIRGYRVELSEIESVLTGHPMVRQAAVLLRQHDGADSQLIAYTAGDTPVEAETLRRWLGDRLPDYMVPAKWVRLEALPLGPNGKIDRRGLVEPSIEDGATPGGALPQGPTETRLAAIWAAVLKRDTVGRDDDFFALGGHSLLAIRLLGRLAKEFGTRLPLRALFDAPTVARLAVVLEPRHPLEEPLTALWRDVLKRDSIGRDEDFFALGGHSLLAIRLLGRIAKQFTVRLPLRTLFDHPTVARLAPLLAPAADGGPEHPPKSEPGITRRARVALEPAAEKPGK